MKNFSGLVVSCLLLSSRSVIASSDDANAALAIVNQARQAKGVQPLTWDPNLKTYAQLWADEMGSGRQPFEHAPASYRPSQGENLYEQSAGQCDAAYDNPLQTAMRAWLSQESLYTGQPITTGHEPWLHWCGFIVFSLSCRCRKCSLSEQLSVCGLLPHGLAVLVRTASLSRTSSSTSADSLPKETCECFASRFSYVQTSTDWT